MTDTPETERENARAQGRDMTSRDRDLHTWFIREVLPLEAALTQYLRHNWREPSNVADLLHDVYVRVFDAAQKELPKSTASFVFAIARNLLVDRVRHQKIVPFEAVENLDALNVAADAPAPDDQIMARDELRKIQTALDHLHPRAREAFLMHHVEGLSRREIAVRMSLSEITVNWYLNQGVRQLADILYRTPGQRTPRR